MMVNISSSAFNEYLGKARSLAAKGELLTLMCPGVWPADLFRGVADGKAIRPCTWMMAFRADMRGNLAFAQLAPWTLEVGPDGQRRRVRPTKQALVDAYTKQHELLMRMRDACPVFFGHLVEEARTTKQVLAHAPNS